MSLLPVSNQIKTTTAALCNNFTQSAGALTGKINGVMNRMQCATLSRLLYDIVSPLLLVFSFLKASCLALFAPFARDASIPENNNALDKESTSQQLHEMMVTLASHLPPSRRSRSVIV